MKVINLNDDIENLFLSKSIIESYWIEQEIITQKYSLDDFIVKLDMGKTIYNSNNIVYPFSIINTDKEIFVFTICDDPKELLDALNKIDYSIENLTKVTKEDLYVNGIIENKSFFIIDNKVYLPKDDYEPSHKLSDESTAKYFNIDTDNIQNIIDETTQNMYELENKL